MSAWVVEKEHIDLLVKLGLEGPHGYRWTSQVYLRGGKRLDFTTADEVGQMLMEECVKSVSYRYPQDDASRGDLPGPGGEDVYYLCSYEYKDHRYRPTFGEAFNIISCYEYQSCEHPEWKDSLACWYCDQLRKTICRLFTEDTPWGWGPRELAEAHERRGKPALRGPALFQG